MSRKKIFISYQREHVEDISLLVRVLESTGKYEVWYDQRIDSGRWWEDHIIANIQKADVILLALSPSYLASVPCQLERQYALDLKKSILPVTVDPKLDLRTLPVEIARLQVKKYFGSAEEFLALTTALDKEQSPPLPDPLPEAPAAPIKPPTPVQSVPQLKRSSINPRLLAVLGGGLVLVLIAELVVINRPSGEPTATSTPSDNTSTMSAQTPISVPSTPASVEEGAFDITLLYGGMDSFAVYVNAPSNLNNVRLTTAKGVDENLTTRFPDLAAYDNQIPEGVCLIYERENSSPTLPLACQVSKVQRLKLSPSGVFWFDDATNLYNNIILRRGETLKQICPHSNGSGKCDVKEDH